MTTVKCLRRQAATCAALAATTYDEESRERYLRLEQIYLHMAAAEDGDAGVPGAIAGDSNTEPAPHRPS